MAIKLKLIKYIILLANCQQQEGLGSVLGCLGSAAKTTFP